VKPIYLTAVRFDEEQGREALQRFVFGGWYGPPRVPRGAPPELVTRFLEQELKPDSETQAYARTVELLEFYERADVLPHLRRALKRQPEDGADLLRAAYVLRAIGDLGTPQEAAQAAAYLDAVLAASPHLTAELFGPLLETLIALAPAGSVAQLARRLAAEVERAAPEQRSGVKQMYRYDRLLAVQKNDLPRTQQAIEIKTQLAARPPEARRADLVRLYLGTAPRGGPQLGIWAARLLRREAMEGDPEPVYQEFGKALDTLDVKTLGEARAKDIAVRAGQAILYLQGTLTPRQWRIFEESQNGALNFLWDDLPALLKR